MCNDRKQCPELILNFGLLQKTIEHNNLYPMSCQGLYEQTSLFNNWTLGESYGYVSQQHIQDKSIGMKNCENAGTTLL